MGVLFCVTGKSCSGKDTIFNKLKQAPNLGLVPVIPYTTRPKRSGEEEGRDYRFITDGELAEYEKKGLVIEKRSYKVIQGVWTYCTIDDGTIDLKNNNYIIIGTICSYNALRSYFGKNFLIPVYVEADDAVRLKRALEREISQPVPDYKEMCRRFLADCEDFSEEKLKDAEIKKYFYNNADAASCIEEIIKYIKRKII